VSLVCWLQTGCQTAGAKSGAAEDGTRFATIAHDGAKASSSEESGDTIDTLHAGDVLTIEFTDMAVPVPLREERIKEDGSITLLEGKTFTASGKTRGQLEKEIHDFYVPRFYLKMTVSVRQQKDTQFYYVRGEVRIPNRQVYISRIRLLQAIASCGDFTDFARKRSVQLTRADGQKLTVNCIKATKDPKLNVEILPGDIIFVPRRNPIW
jgi:polysaccharide export outer membrane protein